MILYGRAFCWGLSWMYVYEKLPNFVCIFTVWSGLLGSVLGCMFMREWGLFRMHVYERVANFVCIFRVGALSWRLSWMHVYERVANCVCILR